MTELSENEKEYKIYGRIVEEITIQYVKKYFSYINTLGVDFPLVIYLSYMDLKDAFIIPPGDLLFGPRHNKFDRNEVLLPGLIIENNEVELTKIFKPIFDMFWQAAGWDSSPYYRNGKWILEKR